MKSVARVVISLVSLVVLLLIVGIGIQLSGHPVVAGPLPSSTFPAATNTPVPYPGPPSTPTLFPSQTSVPVTFPAPPGTMPPATEPWLATPVPPRATVYTAVPPSPSATPAVSASPVGTAAADLRHLWYLDDSDPTASPLLKALLLDDLGQLRGTSPETVRLYEGKDIQPYSRRYSNLAFLMPSLDGRYLLAHTYYGEGPGQGAWVDLQERTVMPAATYIAPTGQNLVVAWQLSNGLPVISSGTTPDPDLLRMLGPHYNLLALPDPAADSQPGASEGALVRRSSLTFAPQGDVLADVWYYPPDTLGSSAHLELFLHDARQNTRVSLLRLEGGSHGAGATVSWSPDGQHLAIVLGKAYPSDLTVELVLVSRADGVVLQLVSGLAMHAAEWSPDGRSLLYLKAEPGSTNFPPACNVFVLDVTSGIEHPLTAFTKTQITDLHWSPTGKLVAYSLERNDHNEIWIADVNGQRPSYLAVNWVAARSVFTWLP